MFLAVLSQAYQEEKLEDGDERVVLRIPAPLAPVKVAVLPLIKKDGLPEKAREIMDTLKLDHNCQYDEKDSIGKRYRRQDAIGTPYCITVDHETLEGRHGDHPRTRHHEAGARGHQRPGADREREGGSKGVVAEAVSLALGCAYGFAHADAIGDHPDDPMARSVININAC